MKYLYFCALLLLTDLVHAQFTQYGIIYPDLDKAKDHCCTIFPPNGGIALYDQPNGTKTGILSRKGRDPYGNEDHYSLVMISNQGDSVKIAMWGDLKEVDNEKMALLFSENRNGFVKILPSQGGLWIKEEELEAQQLRAVNYQSYMTERSGEVLGFYPEAKLNLRKSPSASADLIETLSYLYEISLTGNHQGQWSEVTVIKLKADRCSGEKDIEEYKLQGWIKVLDDEGNLNIWYYTRGC